MESFGRLAALLERFSVEMTATEDEVLGTEFLGNSEARIIVALSRAEPRTTAQLSAHAGCSRGATNRLVGHLEARGLVRRRPAPEDGRAVLVVPTAKGRTAFATYERRLKEFFHVARPLAKEIVDVIERDLGDLIEPVAASKDVDGVLGLMDWISVVGIEIDHAIRRRAGDRFLVGRQRLALVSLAERGDSRPSWIADELELSSAGTTYLVEQLESKGLVTRRRDPIDGDLRTVVVSVTKRGRAAVSAVFAGVRDVVPQLHAVFVAVRDCTKRF